jgi:hypothetical protein
MVGCADVTVCCLMFLQCTAAVNIALGKSSCLSTHSSEVVPMCFMLFLSRFWRRGPSHLAWWTDADLPNASGLWLNGSMSGTLLAETEVQFAISHVLAPAQASSRGGTIKSVNPYSLLHLLDAVHLQCSPF